MDDFWGFANSNSECCRVNAKGWYVVIETGNDTYTTLRAQDATLRTSAVTIVPVPGTQHMSSQRW
ncbi:hypothetical protein V7S43_018604 [Phytophthora oleae]|uniref:Ricin B lectin domain-containing protein n=1 Tax=Phytophthora oleae TaxID=2107226 RepID=A0ABD3EU28_9STRA